MPKLSFGRSTKIETGIDGKGQIHPVRETEQLLFRRILSTEIVNHGIFLDF